jgi:sortase B
MSDDYAVIYGHNMDGKAMFGHINDFESADFFSRHKTGRLFLSDGNVKDLSVVAYAQIEDNEQVGYNVDAYSKGKNDDILEHFKAVAINSDFSHNHERLLLLSTCYQHSSRRAVLLVGYDN